MPFSYRDAADAKRPCEGTGGIRRILRRTGTALLLAPVLLTVAACTQAPVTGRQQLILMSQQEAAQMGAQAYQQVLNEKGVSSNQALQQRVDRVGGRIAQAVDTPYEWEFTLIDDDTANAFALPGGKVGVHTGLFNVVESDAQLAAVLGHESAHVTARHSAERFSQQALTKAGVGIAGAASGSQAFAQVLAQGATLGIQLPFSRAQEAEADEIGMHYMARAGYDPHAAVQVWQNFAAQGGKRPPEFLSTHPAPGNRIEHLQSLLPEVMPIYRQNAG